MKRRTISTLLASLFCIVALGQVPGFSWQRNIEGAAEGWQQIELLDSVFAHVNPSVSDLRIYGFSETGDTLEVPYLMRVLTDKTKYAPISFRTINKTKRNGHSFFTFVVPKGRTVNYIDLDFNRDNFDWRVDVEGSHEQSKWFALKRNYRVVGIRNAHTNYKFTRIYFHPANYKYLRVRIRNNWYNYFAGASIFEKTGDAGAFREYTPTFVEKKINKQTKNTEIRMVLPQKVPVSELSLKINDKVDFVRPISVEYLVDSTKTEKKYIRNFRQAERNTLSSFEENKFTFNTVYTRELRIVVSNYDNLPLNFGEISVRGNVHQLIVRFPEAKRYAMAYGNPKEGKPTYDLQYFQDNIPEKLKKVSLGTAQYIAPKQIPKEVKQESEWWLWLVIGGIGSMLVFFVVRMMMAEKNRETMQE